MALGYGVIAAAAQIGLESILIRPRRSIGGFAAHVTLSERHTDELEVVEHPVEQGALVADHAFKRPPEVVIECAWSNSPRSGVLGAITGTVAGVQALVTGNSPDQVRDVYNRLLALQATAEPFEVVTGKRTYPNMLIRTLTVETDKDSEHVLRVTATLRQVLFATVRVVAVSAPREQQADPEATLAPASKGVKQLLPNPRNFNIAKAVDSLTPTLKATLP